MKKDKCIMNASCISHEEYITSHIIQLTFTFDMLQDFLENLIPAMNSKNLNCPVCVVVYQMTEKFDPKPVIVLPSLARAIFYLPIQENPFRHMLKPMKFFHIPRQTFTCNQSANTISV